MRHNDDYFSLPELRIKYALIRELPSFSKSIAHESHDAFDRHKDDLAPGGEGVNILKGYVRLLQLKVAIITCRHRKHREIGRAKKH